MICLNRNDLKKQSMKWKHTDSPVKKTFLEQRSVYIYICRERERERGERGERELVRQQLVTVILTSLSHLPQHIYIYREREREKERDSESLFTTL